MNLTILYRGPLSSCNYECSYGPFAKRHETAAELAVDRRALNRFIKWIERRADHTFSILFTPWGEALTRRWYQEGLARLSHLPNVRKAAIQTNLSCELDWIERCDTDRLALWCTFHPTQVTRERFVARCQELLGRGVRFSVGVVGLHEHRDEIESLRSELPPEVYLWINALKSMPDYYSQADLQFLESIDPLFPVNAQRHASLGQPCSAGETAISVDGAGTIRRCHFIREPIGNLYDDNFEDCLQQRPCSNATCGCHIGYVHLQPLGLAEVFGEGLLERIPANTVWSPASGSLPREQGKHNGLASSTP